MDSDKSMGLGESRRSGDVKPMLPRPVLPRGEATDITESWPLGVVGRVMEVSLGAGEANPGEAVEPIILSNLFLLTSAGSVEAGDAGAAASPSPSALSPAPPRPAQAAMLGIMVFGERC
jgi:hypothetical protein